MHIMHYSIDYILDDDNARIVNFQINIGSSEIINIYIFKKSRVNSLALFCFDFEMPI